MRKNILKKLAILAVGGALFLSGCSAGAVGFADEETSMEGADSNVVVEGESEDRPEFIVDYTEDNAPIATIEIEGRGVIKAELYPELAPNTVNNFIYLANTGFYDGLTFHRIIEDFMIQGGCPEGTGMGNPGYSIEGEFKSNKFEQNNLAHTPGVLSMARSANNNSAGSQFFIMTSDSPHLDGSYAAFGKVVEGMEVVDEISKVDTDGSDKPEENIVIKSITVDTKGEQYDEPVHYEPKELPIATIEIEGRGTILAELYPELAPNTVDNFIYLANSGFYDGLTFHRIIEDFMVQGGCPEGNGMGNPGYSIEGEFMRNGFTQNTLAHTPGVLSMARANDPDSAGSQFFIMTSVSPYLDANYAGFGMVIEGMDIVMEMSTVDTDRSDKPTEDVVIKSITVDTKGEEYDEPIRIER